MQSELEAKFKKSVLICKIIFDPSKTRLEVMFKFSSACSFPDCKKELIYSTKKYKLTTVLPQLIYQYPSYSGVDTMAVSKI